MDWMKIVSAVALGLMLIALIPRAKNVLGGTPKGSAADWQAAVLPVLAVIVFVAILMSVA
jgi:hypothetical protein